MIKNVDASASCPNRRPIVQKISPLRTTFKLLYLQLLGGIGCMRTNFFSLTPQ